MIIACWIKQSEQVIFLSFGGQKCFCESACIVRLYVHNVSCFDESIHNFSTLSEKAWTFSIVLYPPHSIDIQGAIASKYETLSG
jgi:hypothetical protein